jgi:enoyl-CoA hydratase
MLKVTRDGAAIVWTIDRPQTKNALDAATMDALHLATVAAQQDSHVRAAILTGTGDAFASGGDLNELRNKVSRGDAEALSDRGDALCRALESLPFPVIAVIPGAALGGGAELAMACDMRVAEAGAKIGFVQARMGVTPAWGTTSRLVSALGTHRAAKLLLTGAPVTADQAYILGLVEEVTRSGGGMDIARAWVHSITQCSPTAIARTKALLVRSRSGLYDHVRPLERQSFIDTWTGADHLDAVEAYFEHRLPRWGAR